MKPSDLSLKDAFKEEEYSLQEFFDEINSEYDNESEIRVILIIEKPSK